MLRVVHIASEMPQEKLIKPRKLTRRQQVVTAATELMPVLQFYDRQKANRSFPEMLAEIAKLELSIATKTLKK